MPEYKAKKKKNNESLKDTLEQTLEDEDEESEEFDAESDVEESSGAKGFFRKIKNGARRVKNRFKKEKPHSDEEQNDLEPEKDILFNSEKIVKDQSEKNREKKEKAIKTAQEAAKVAKEEYLTMSIESDVRDFSKIKAQMLEKRDSLPDSPELAKSDDETSSFSDIDQAADRLLERADKKVELLKSAESSRKGKNYDYKLKILDDALNRVPAKAQGEAPQITQTRKVLEAAKKKYHAQQVSDMGVIKGIKQMLESYEKKYQRESELIEHADDQDKEMLINDRNQKYGDDAACNAAAEEALKRAEKRAEYLKDNDEQQDKDKDYVQLALDEAKRAGDDKSFETKAEHKGRNGDDMIAKVLKKAQEQYDDKKAKIQEEIKKKNKEEQKKYDEESQVKEALKELNNQRADLEKAKEDYRSDAGMAKWYSDKLKEIDEKRAEVALKTRQEVKRAKAQKEKQEAEELAKKAAEEKQEQERKLSEAREKAKEKIKEKEKIAASQSSSQPNQSTQANSSDQTAKSNIDQDAHTDADSDSNNDEDYIREFLESIVPKSTKYSGRFYDDDDDDDDDDTSEEEKKIHEENYRKSKKAIKFIRPVNDISENMNLYIKNLKKMVMGEEIIDNTDSKGKGNFFKNLRARHKTKKIRNNRLQIINALEKDINQHFQIHSRAIKEYEQIIAKTGQLDSSIPYIMEMSTLLGKIHNSLNTARQKLINEHSKMTDVSADKVANNIKEDINYTDKAANNINYTDKVANNLKETDDNRLHSLLFKKLVKELMMNHKITILTESGTPVKFNPFIDSENSYGRRRYFSNINNSSRRITGGLHYMAALRTIINVCRAQMQFDPDSSGIVSGIVSECEKIEPGAHNMSDTQLSESIRRLAREVLTSETIGRLTGNSSGDKQSKNASKLSKIMELLQKLSQSPSNNRIIREIELALKNFNNFSGLNIRGQNDNYLTDLYKPGNSYTYVPEKK